MIVSTLKIAAVLRTAGPAMRSIAATVPLR
jgi:hypothetical protein